MDKNQAKDNAVMKWESIVKMMDFKKSDIPKVCEYADLHTLLESTNHTVFPGTTEFIPKYLEDSMLPISLKVLSKVKDLSKVHFEYLPVFRLMRDGEICSETMKTHSISSDVTRDQIVELKRQTGIDLIAMVESELIEKLAGIYNKLIEDGNELYVFVVAQSIAIVAEGTQAPQIRLLSRFHIEGPGVWEKSITINDL